MEKTVQELKMIVRELMLEVGDLKDKVAYLEKEVNNLNIVSSSKPKTEKLKILGEQYENLSIMYKEGFHICPTAYGEIRTGECLFCAGFIAKE